MLFLWTIRGSLQKQVIPLKQWQRGGSREAAHVLPGGVLRWQRGQGRPGRVVVISLTFTSSSRYFIHSSVRSLRRSFKFPFLKLSSWNTPSCAHSHPHRPLHAAPQEAGAHPGGSLPLTQHLPLGDARGRVRGRTRCEPWAMDPFL